LTNNYRWNRKLKNYIHEINWFFVPVVNPDGYEFSRSSTEPEVSKYDLCIISKSSKFMKKIIKRYDYGEKIAAEMAATTQIVASV